MKKFGLNELREKYLAFFDQNDHLTVRSYPLIPQEDKTLLFIVAGMVPLKNYFSGLAKPPKTRMATVQKCIRTNDIDNVGYTARHASFFEMLGNFSFGDYFKKEAIRMAWDFSTKVIELPVDRIWVTVYEEDDEAYELWQSEVGVPAEKIVRLGKDDNFWEIGTGTGPCGPCSELFFDRGEKHGCKDPNCKPGCDCDRYVEYWNLVFTQFDKQADGSLVPLAHPNIDTGMGLERLACIVQEVNSIFDIDTFRKIIAKIEEISGKTYGEKEEDDVSMRVITDHIRAVTFVSSEGVVPDNEGRGYVLRMLFRRAVRRGRMLGIQENFMSRLAEVVVDAYSESYTDLEERKEYIKSIIDQEEDRFNKTLDSGLKILEEMMEDLKQSGSQVLSGEDSFKLYDTYGFPFDLTKDILREHRLSADENGFNACMQEQKTRARNARGSSEAGWDTEDMNIFPDIQTTFTGYDRTLDDTEVLFIAKDNEAVERVSFDTGEQGNVYLMLKESPFYFESGGQVSDSGNLYNEHFEAEILELKKLPGGRRIHKIKLLKGTVSVHDKITAAVDSTRRFDIRKNHSATHLLHKALKVVLGPDTVQAGSLVDENRTRFDFTFNRALTVEEIKEIEEIVNQKIFEFIPVKTEIMDLEDAKKCGAMALFGEKYEDRVRVLSMGDFSIELCGGTHVANTSDIGIFKIVSQSAAAAGIRRIEAITGRAVYELMQKEAEQLREMSVLLKTQPSQLIGKLEQVLEEKKELQASLKKLKEKSASDELKKHEQSVELIKGVSVLAEIFEEVDADTLRSLADDRVNRKEAALAVLASIEGEKVNFVVKANKSAVEQGVHSGKIAKELAGICGGGGGGKPEMAQAGGKDSSKVKEAMAGLKEII
ncbi:MAG: alanine--tRNA ligase [Bacillota bacterium]|nr:alanine--tRNA ligase [Bacillota bacterium]